MPRGTRDLSRRLRRAVARLDPAAVANKTRTARSARCLQFFKDRYGDGSAGLSGTAPSQLMALIAAAIDLDARPRLDGDCRTIDMRRFDVLADWARQRLGLPTENSHPDHPTPLDRDTATAAAAALLAYANTGQDQPDHPAAADSHPADAAPTDTAADPHGHTHTRPAERHHHEPDWTDSDWTDWTDGPDWDPPDPAPATPRPEEETQCPF